MGVHYTQVYIIILGERWYVVSDIGTGCPVCSKLLTSADLSSLSPGLAVPLVGVNAYATAAPLIDKMVTVRYVFSVTSLLSHQYEVLLSLAFILFFHKPNLRCTCLF